MDGKTSVLLFGALLCLLALGGPACADLSQSSSPITGKVFVSSVSFDPGAFFTGDTGTVTYTVVNGNTNTSVILNRGTFYDKEFILTSDSYDHSNALGPLQSRPFTFSIRADASEGDYYPTFSLDLADSTLYYKSVVKVDNTPVELTIVDKPDAFSEGKKKTIYLQASNPRNNDVKNIILDVKGEGITATPSRIFVGSLAAGGKAPVNITITPEKPTTLHLTLNYDNGNNPHKTTLEIPVLFGTDKKQADPVMSNVQVKNTGGTYHITGDVNNAGLETANTVKVTTLSPAVPQDPYKIYVVGALKPDDFGSFEVTFSAPNATAVPVQLSFKDADGNVYNSVQDVRLSESGVTDQKSGGGFPTLPVAAGIIIVLIFVGGWAIHLRRMKK